MLAGNVDAATVLQYIGCGDYCGGNITDFSEFRFVNDVILPAAWARIEAYTGLGRSELNAKEDVTIPLLALCSYLYDNRSMATSAAAKEDAVINAMLSAYRVNLVG